MPSRQCCSAILAISTGVPARRDFYATGLGVKKQGIHPSGIQSSAPSLVSRYSTVAGRSVIAFAPAQTTTRGVRASSGRSAETSNWVPDGHLQCHRLQIPADPCSVCSNHGSGNGCSAGSFLCHGRCKILPADFDRIAGCCQGLGFSLVIPICNSPPARRLLLVLLHSAGSHLPGVVPVPVDGMR